MNKLSDLTRSLNLIPIANRGIRINPKNKGKFTVSAKRA